MTTSTVTLASDSSKTRADYLDHFRDFAKEKTSDVLETIITCLDWVPYFNVCSETAAFSEKASSQLEPMKKVLSIPEFFGDLRTYNKNWQDYSKDNLDIYDHSATTIRHGSESMIGLHLAGIIDLKKGLQAAKSLFWGAIFVGSGIDLYQNGVEVKEYQAKMETAKTPEAKAYFGKRITLTYLERARDIAYIALASIALVSILFASMAQGLLFSPGVFLGFATAGLVFDIASFFYKKVLDQEKIELNIID